MNTLNLRPGDIVFRHHTNIVTKAGQKILMKGSTYASASHAGIIVKTTATSISILESNREGLRVNKYKADAFNAFIGGEMHVLRSEELKDELEAKAKIFAESYEARPLKFSYKHMITSIFFSVKDNKKGRKRSIHSFLHNKLMTSKGKRRKAGFCTELVGEIVKAAQISKVTNEKEEQVNIKNLKRWQKEGLILDISSENIGPGDLEKQLVKFNFQVLKFS